MLSDAEQLQNTPLAGLDPKQVAQVAPAKLAAARQAPAIRALLWPEDDDG